VRSSLFSQAGYWCCSSFCWLLSLQARLCKYRSHRHPQSFHQQPCRVSAPSSQATRTTNHLTAEGLSVPPSLDEIDVIRHREITSKAVSAILLLVLKWFKVSRMFHFLGSMALYSNVCQDVMKFHHLGQHLLDTNCLLLILKMFGLQEVTNSVVSKADSPENK